MILESGAVKELFLVVLKKAKTKYNFSVENFCIMGNHFHLIIRPANGVSLSSVMRWIMSVFAMRFNRRMHLTGHVWGERFFSRVIRSLRDWLLAFEYIDDNPVNSGLCDSPTQWRFGGLWHHRRRIHTIVENPAMWTQLLLPIHSPSVVLLPYTPGS